MLRKILRVLTIIIVMVFAWPYFLYKKYGNIGYKLENKTIIVANHYSTFDPFFIYLIYRRKKIHFVTIIDTKKKILSRYVTWIFDCLFIDYDSKNISFFKKTIDILKNDGIICIFPEGVVNIRKYGFFDFEKSFIYFCLKSKANILPLYIYPEMKLFRKSKIYIGDIVKYEKIKEINDYEKSAIYVQNKVMEYSLLFENEEIQK